MATRKVMIQYPAGAPPGFPISARHMDGLGEPIHSARPHSHGFFALMFVTAGTGIMSVGRANFPVSAGSFVITAPGEVHDTAQCHGVSRWALDFVPDAFGSEAAGWLFPRPTRPEWSVLLRRSWQAAQVISIPVERMAEWIRQFHTITRELTEQAPGYREVVRAELKTLLIRTGRLNAQPAPEAIAPLLGDVFDVIEKRYAESVSLADVARAVGRSTAHLTTVVRQQTGMTVQQWIIERRMAEARQRLMGTDENVDVIAERVGYRDATLFIRHFKRAHGVTPRHWRNGS